MSVDVQTALDRYQRLGMIVRALAASDLGLEEIANITLQQGMAGMNASGAGIGFRRGDRFHRVAAVGSTARSIRRMGSRGGPVSVHERNPSCLAAAAGEEVWITDRAAGQQRFPHLVNTSPTSQGWVVLPLNHAGTTFGSLSLSFVAPPVFEPPEQEFVRALVDVAALALVPFHGAWAEAGPAGWRSPEAPGDPLAGVLADGTTDGVVAVDGGGTIVLCNEHLCRMLGYEATELIGRSVEVLIPFGRREEHVQERHRYVDDPVPRSWASGLDLVALRADGTELAVDVALSPCTTADGLRTVAVVRPRARL